MPTTMQAPPEAMAAKRKAILATMIDRPWLLKESHLRAIAAQDPANFRAGEFMDYQAAKYSWRIEGDVAIIPISGVLTGKYTWMTWLFEGTSCDQIAAAFSDAMANGDIRKIVLEIDSPGGEVDGIEPLASVIYDARKSGAKQISAYVNSIMCSAAAWLGTAAGEIVLSSKTDITGSIGVVTVHRSIAEMEKKFGIETTEIYAGKYKRIASPYKPLSEEGRATLQDQVDRIYGVFIEAVARNKGISTEAALGMADGRIFIGEQAIEAGLADRFGSLSSIVSKPGKSVAFSAVTTEAKHMPDENKPEITTEYLQLNHSALLADIRAKAFEDGKSAGIVVERERIKQIKALAIEGYEDVTDRAIADGQSPEKASMALVQAVKDRGITIAALKGESQFAGAAVVNPPATAKGEKTPEERHKRALALAEKANKGRA